MAAWHDYHPVEDTMVMYHYLHLSIAPCTLQEETATSRQLAKVLTELVGEDMIREWQMLYRAGWNQVMPFPLALALALALVMPCPAALYCMVMSSPIACAGRDPAMPLLLPCPFYTAL